MWALSRINDGGIATTVRAMLAWLGLDVIRACRAGCPRRFDEPLTLSETCGSKLISVQLAAWKRIDGEAVAPSSPLIAALTESGLQLVGLSANPLRSSAILTNRVRSGIPSWI